ncbi:hypothetical protein Tco_1152975 [Tanacetum coccineum]
MPQEMYKNHESKSKQSQSDVANSKTWFKAIDSRQKEPNPVPSRIAVVQEYVSQARCGNFKPSKSCLDDLRWSSKSNRPPGYPPKQNPHSNRQNNFNQHDAYSANNGSTEDVQPPVVQIQSRNPNPEPNVSPVDTPIPKASIPFPSRRNDERRKEKD